MTSYDSTIAGAPQTRSDTRALRNRFVSVLYVMVALWGVVQMFPDLGFVQFAVALLLACVATTCLALDARLRGYFVPNVVYFLVLVTWPVALPVYLIYALGWRGVGWSLLHACCLYALLMVSVMITFIVLFALGIPVTVAQ
jgi:hypothetical protein